MAYQAAHRTIPVEFLLPELRISNAIIETYALRIGGGYNSMASDEPGRSTRCLVYRGTLDTDRAQITSAGRA